MASSTSTLAVKPPRSVRPSPKVFWVVRRMIITTLILSAVHYGNWLIGLLAIVDQSYSTLKRPSNPPPRSLGANLLRMAFWFVVIVFVVTAVYSSAQISDKWQPPRAILNFIERPGFLTALWFIFLVAVLRQRQKLLHDEPPADN